MIKLDKYQEEITYAPKNAHYLVLAGPGTGKTELVAQRILYLLNRENLKPGELLVLSFSRSAVKVLTNRIRSLEPSSPGMIEDLRHVSIRTFDSWTYRMLRFLGFSVTECLNRSYEANIEILSDLLRKKGHKIISSKNNCGLYRIKHVIVDELQDLSGVRADLVISLLDILCRDVNSEIGFTLLGDMYQAIYDFAYRANSRGLSSGQFIESLRDSWKTSLNERELKVNYRSGDEVIKYTKKIAEIMHKEAERNRDPLPDIKRLLDSLPVKTLNNVLGSVNKSTAVLCRNNGQALLMGSELLRDAHNIIAQKVKLQTAGNPGGMPYWLGALLSLYTGNAPLTRNDVSRIIQALKSRKIDLPYDADQYWLLLTRIMSIQVDTGISMKDLISRLRWPDSLPDDIYEDNDEVIMLTTVHQSKGQEYDNVLVFRDRLAEQSRASDDPGEEARITYVASSRARSSISAIEDALFVNLRKRKTGSEARERWYGMKIENVKNRRRYLHHLEIGIKGDIDEYSFANTVLLGGETNVREFQKYLTVNALPLKGEKIILKKNTVNCNGDRKVFYKVYLGRHDGETLIGLTNEQLSLDLLSLRPRDDLKLPKEIHGLRISEIYSFVSDNNNRDNIAEPFSKSGIWLCASVYGIGQYEYYYYRG
jgi:DNA helicase II / ATP-dependent DNA helicase PcrA